MTALHGLLSDIETVRRHSEPITGPLPYEEQALAALIQAREQRARDVVREVATPQQMDKLFKELDDKTCNKAANHSGSKILYPNSACADHD